MHSHTQTHKRCRLTPEMRNAISFQFQWAILPSGLSYHWKDPQWQKSRASHKEAGERWTGTKSNTFAKSKWEERLWRSSSHERFQRQLHSVPYNSVMYNAWAVEPVAINRLNFVYQRTAAQKQSRAAALRYRVSGQKGKWLHSLMTTYFHHARPVFVLYLYFYVFYCFSAFCCCHCLLFFHLGPRCFMSPFEFSFIFFLFFISPTQFTLLLFSIFSVLWFWWEINLSGGRVVFYLNKHSSNTV